MDYHITSSELYGRNFVRVTCDSGKLDRVVYEFRFDENKHRMVLCKFIVLFRKSNRHKFQEKAKWDSYDNRNSSLLIQEIILPIEVKREVVAAFMAEFAVVTPNEDNSG